MSGMSMDGLDLALVRIQGAPERPQVDLVAHDTRDYDAQLRARMQRARSGTVEDVSLLDFDLAECWSQWVLEFLERAGTTYRDIHAIGSHGQTLFHQPKTAEAPARTLQIGRGDILAARTKIRTVCDFRPRDIAEGGEGAPLIPLVDWLLYRDDHELRGCVNLGSIANMTVLTPRRSDVLGFDIGPANALIDAFASDTEGHPRFDKDGAIARATTVSEDVLLSLYTSRAKWIAASPPKSAGYDTFGPALVQAIKRKHPDVPPEVLVATATEFTAEVLRDGIENHVLIRHQELRRLLFSGGGCRNGYLMECISEKLSALDIETRTLPDAWIDAKEAVGFALLADRRLLGLPGNLPSATGATRAVALGTVHDV